MKANPKLALGVGGLIGIYVLVKNIDILFKKPLHCIKYGGAVISFGVFIYYYLYLTSPFQYYAPPLAVSLALLMFVSAKNAPKNNTGTFRFFAKERVADISGLTWSLREFCRGWSIIGETGSGKTRAGIMTLLHQLFKNESNWGGLTVDAKGSFFRLIEGVGENYGIKDKVIILKTGDNKPEQTFNLLSVENIPWQTYAKIIVDVASSQGQGGGGGASSFFRTQARNAIHMAMELLDALYQHEGKGEKVKLDEVKDILSENGAKAILKMVPDELKNNEAYLYFQNDYLVQAEKAPQQFAGIVSTISNYLSPYTGKDVKNVFCASESTFSLDEIDNGKVICVSIPAVNSNRDYINTFVKHLFYHHVLSREDLTQDELNNKNLAVFIADEAQDIVTKSEGMDDSKVVAKIRSSRGTVIFATQSSTSYLDRLGQFKTETLLLNLANKIYFRPPDDRGAKMAESELSKDEDFEKQSYGYSNTKGSVTYQKRVKGKFRDFELRKFKDFECVVKHCTKGIKHVFLPPLDFKGKKEKYYSK